MPRYRPLGLFWQAKMVPLTELYAEMNFLGFVQQDPVGQKPGLDLLGQFPLYGTCFC